MAKKKQSESVATKSTIILRPRTPVVSKSTMVLRPRTLVSTKSSMVLRPRIVSTGEEKVKQKVKGKKSIASGKIGMVDSEKGEIVRKRKIMAVRRKTETAENIVKRVKTMNKNEMDKAPTKGSIRVLGLNSAKKGDESRKEVVKKGSANDKTMRPKTELPKEASLAIRSLRPKKYFVARKDAPLSIRSPKPAQNVHVTASTRVLRPRTPKAKGEMPVKVEEKTKGTIPVEVDKKINAQKTVASGKIRNGNAIKIRTAAKRKYVTDKGNTEVLGSRMKNLKAIIKKNEMHKGAATGNTQGLGSNRGNEGDESKRKDTKKGSVESKCKKLKNNLLGKKEVPITIQIPSPKKIIHVKKKAFATTGSPKPKKNFPAEASKEIAREGGKLEDPLSKERAKDTIANNHRNVQGFNNQGNGTNGKNQHIKRKKTKIIVTGSVFPPEIIMEILSWLPVKFFGTPMVVCKQWNALIHDRHFIEKHMNRTASYVEAEVRQGYEKVSYCDCLQLEMNTSTRKYRVRNPDTKQFLELPDAHSRSHLISFSYVPVTLNYKVVLIYANENIVECCDLSVGNDALSWRLLKMPTQDHPEGDRKKFSAILIGDILHCVRVIAREDDMVEEVVSFDLGTEQFSVINLPKGQYKSWESVWPIDFKGKLALVDIIGAELCVSVLENYKKQEWGKKRSLVPVELMKKLEVEYGTVYPDTVDQFEILWFWVKNAKKWISYDINTKIICSKHGHRHSLVRLKGMQPE